MPINVLRTGTSRASAQRLRETLEQLPVTAAREIQNLVADRHADARALAAVTSAEHAERQILNREVASGAFAVSTQLRSRGSCVSSIGRAVAVI